LDVDSYVIFKEVEGMTEINSKINDMTDALRNPDGISDQELIPINHKMVDIMHSAQNMSNVLS